MDINRLKQLEQTTDIALFNLHYYLCQEGDDFWREIYRHRVEIGNLIEARKRFHSTSNVHKTANSL